MASLTETSSKLESEEDVIYLVQRGELSQSAADVLIEFIHEGVDLNTALPQPLFQLSGMTDLQLKQLIELRRERMHRQDAGTVVAPRVLLEDQRSISSPKKPFQASVRAVTQYTLGDELFPPLLLNGRVSAPQEGLMAGMTLHGARRVIAQPTLDSFSRELTTTGLQYSPQLPRFFLQFERERLKLIVGTFDIGFAERLTLDVAGSRRAAGLAARNDFSRRTGRVRRWPFSQPLDDDLQTPHARLVTPDFEFQDTFRGISASLRDLPLGSAATLAVTAFGSIQSRRVAPREVFDRTRCDGSQKPDIPCETPIVRLADSPAILISSVPALTAIELAGGGHAEISLRDWFQLGVTGYLARLALEPSFLDFRDSSRFPSGGLFGALGIDARVSGPRTSFHFELSRSFDRSVGNRGGGWAAVARGRWFVTGHELELSGHLFDPHFQNPFARPVAFADEEFGQRARNEAGLRFRSWSTLSQWQFRTRFDVWGRPFNRQDAPAGTIHLSTTARVGFSGWRSFQPSLWMGLRSRNFSASSFEGCSTSMTDSAWTPSLAQDGRCLADSYRAALLTEFQLIPARLSLAQQAVFVLVSPSATNPAIRADLQFWSEIKASPTDWFRIHLRARYSFQDVSTHHIAQSTLWSSAYVTISPASQLSVAARYDFLHQPSPVSLEHRFLLDVSASFEVFDSRK